MVDINYQLRHGGTNEKRNDSRNFGDTLRRIRRTTPTTKKASKIEGIVSNRVSNKKGAVKKRKFLTDLFL